MAEVTTAVQRFSLVGRIFAIVIPTGGRNLLVAGAVALQGTADSSTASPFRNDKDVGRFAPAGARI